jgi:hypothetical protein
MISIRGTLRTCTLRMRSRREYASLRSVGVGRCPAEPHPSHQTDGRLLARRSYQLACMGASFREFDIAKFHRWRQSRFQQARHPVDVARTKFDEDAST